MVVPKIAKKMEEELAAQVVHNEGENSSLQQDSKEVDKLEDDIAGIIYSNSEQGYSIVLLEKLDTRK